MRTHTDRPPRALRQVGRASLALALASCVLSSAGAPPERTSGPLVIHGTGDVSLDPAQIPAFRTHGYDWAWSGLGSLFERDDLTVVNLECPATDLIDPVSKAFTIRCDPAALPAASRAGVDIMSQANNHAYDEGPGGLVDSLDRIRSAQIAPVGAGVDQAEALRAAMFEIDGWTIGVVGIDQVVDPAEAVAGPNEPGTAAGHDVGLALRAVRDAAASCDLVIVTIHWGVELDAQPRRSQVLQAHRMIDAGADVIFGSHPHALQPMESYRGRPIFYSLGNLVWPRGTAAGSETAIAEVTVDPDGTIHGHLLPVLLVSDGHPVLEPAPNA